MSPKRPGGPGWPNQGRGSGRSGPCPAWASPYSVKLTLPPSRRARSTPKHQSVNGVIFQEIGSFAQSLLGPHAWEGLQLAVCPPGRVYYRVADYPDEEAMALIAAMAEQMHEPPGTVLYQLGEFIALDLLRMAHYWIAPEWRTLDLIVNTEATIHAALRNGGSRTDPPRLRTRRTGPNEVEVLYDSPRRLCALARGIIVGLAKHYGEDVTVTESACMLKGDPACLLVARVTPPAG